MVELLVHMFYTQIRDIFENMNAIIIDDEKTGARGLQKMLLENCSQVKIIALENTPEKGIDSILSLKPDLIFLDIEMPNATGFDVIDATRDIDYEVIFTTAYEHYAVKAFKAHAIDYLLKPIDINELINSVKSASLKIENKKNSGINHRLESLLKTIGSPKGKKVPIPTNNGVILVAPEDIVCLESASNYTHVFLKDGRKFLISKTLKNVEEKLNHYFCRVHSAYVVNLNEVEQYIRGDGGVLMLQNKMSVPVSRAHKQELMSRLGL